MIPIIIAAVVLCGPAPVVISQPGTYEWCPDVAAISANDAAIRIIASDVMLTGALARDSRRCLEILASRVTVRGATFTTCVKIAIQVIGAVTDVIVERSTITDSGNGVLTYTSGEIGQRRVSVVGNVIRNMGGSVDGHGVGVQSCIGCVVSGNFIEKTQRAAISFYWWAQDFTPQTDNVIERNFVLNPGGVGISLGSSNGEATTKYGNVVRHNTVLATQPLYLKGNLTPSADLWAVEATDNYAPGVSSIGRATASGCPRVYAVRNSGASYSGSPVGC